MLIARAFARLLLVVALFTSAGAHWLVLQSVAWTAMLVENSQRGSLVEAVAKTFDGTHPCGLCEKIAAGKSKEQKRDLPSFSGKIELIHDAGAVALSPPCRFRELRSSPLQADARRSRPLLEPPRLS